jgi:hypothetical protein
VAASSDRKNISLRMRLARQADAVFQDFLHRASACTHPKLEEAFSLTQVKYLPSANRIQYGSH